MGPVSFYRVVTLFANAETLNKPLAFASTNKHKYAEINSILSAYDIEIEFAPIDIVEIQSDSQQEIAIEKCRTAFAKLSKPVIVEDDGLFVNELNGFPGQYSAFVFKTIGNKGILKLMRTSKDRSASFHAILAFCDGNKPILFEGIKPGRIAGRETSGGWGYDPIFIPEGENLTFGQFGDRKSRFSHRAEATSRFAAWYSRHRTR